MTGSTKNHEDFSPTGSNFASLKFIGGLVQLGVGILVYTLNNYFFHEPLVELGGLAFMGLGFFLLGYHNKVVVSPSKKSIVVSQGFFLPIIQHTYYAADIDHVKVSKRMRTKSTDSDDITFGPSSANQFTIKYTVKLILRNQKIVKLHSEQDKNVVMQFAKCIVNELPIKGGLKLED